MARHVEILSRSGRERRSREGGQEESLTSRSFTGYSIVCILRDKLELYFQAYEYEYGTGARGMGLSPRKLLVLCLFEALWKHSFLASPGSEADP